ncbi:Hypothetical Protein FCC1311_058282 [Hondaea fermentalgiana]|uniref:Uncharacterized protein n=1 Tax=Hondaea fermentalgiana TaxID=2315210 RepID=A0A2R5GFE4_9STRA|nr:Hypothetical Protein FCC1311_058282 [Hondaea fermentalgiana]|eukprot:GBG29607.1 Hypothetical Protein FCC1311_058282 [Hondaea fermentalgiana]
MSEEAPSYRAATAESGGDLGGGDDVDLVLAGQQPATTAATQQREAGAGATPPGSRGGKDAPPLNGDAAEVSEEQPKKDLDPLKETETDAMNTQVSETQDTDPFASLETGHRNQVETDIFQAMPTEDYNRNEDTQPASEAAEVGEDSSPDSAGELHVNATVDTPDAANLEDAAVATDATEGNLDAAVKDFAGIDPVSDAALEGETASSEMGNDAQAETFAVDDTMAPHSTEDLTTIENASLEEATESNLGTTFEGHDAHADNAKADPLELEPGSVTTDVGGTDVLDDENKQSAETVSNGLDMGEDVAEDAVFHEVQNSEPTGSVSGRNDIVTDDGSGEEGSSTPPSISKAPTSDVGKGDIVQEAVENDTFEDAFSKPASETVPSTESGVDKDVLDTAAKEEKAGEFDVIDATFEGEDGGSGDIANAATYDDIINENHSSDAANPDSSEVDDENETENDNDKTAAQEGDTSDIDSFADNNMAQEDNDNEIDATVKDDLAEIDDDVFDDADVIDEIAKDDLAQVDEDANDVDVVSRDDVADIDAVADIDDDAEIDDAEVGAAAGLDTNVVDAGASLDTNSIDAGADLNDNDVDVAADLDKNDIDAAAEHDIDATAKDDVDGIEDRTDDIKDDNDTFGDFDDADFGDFDDADFASPAAPLQDKNATEANGAESRDNAIDLAASGNDFEDADFGDFADADFEDADFKQTAPSTTLQLEETSAAEAGTGQVPDFDADFDDDFGDFEDADFEQAETPPLVSSSATTSSAGEDRALNFLELPENVFREAAEKVFAPLRPEQRIPEDSVPGNGHEVPQENQDSSQDKLLRTLLSDAKPDAYFGPSKCSACGALLRYLSRHCLVCGHAIVASVAPADDCVASAIACLSAYIHVESKVIHSNDLRKKLRTSLDEGASILLGQAFASLHEPRSPRASVDSSALLAAEDDAALKANADASFERGVDRSDSLNFDDAGLSLRPTSSTGHATDDNADHGQDDDEAELTQNTLTDLDEEEEDDDDDDDDNDETSVAKSEKEPKMNVNTNAAVMLPATGSAAALVEQQTESMPASTDLDDDFGFFEGAPQLDTMGLADSPAPAQPGPPPSSPPAPPPPNASNDDFLGLEAFVGASGDAGNVESSSNETGDANDPLGLLASFQSTPNDTATFQSSARDAASGALTQEGEDLLRKLWQEQNPDREDAGLPDLSFMRHEGLALPFGSNAATLAARRRAASNNQDSLGTLNGTSANGELSHFAQANSAADAAADEDDPFAGL